MTTPDLPPQQWICVAPTPDGRLISLASEESVEPRERILFARIAELQKDLADCFRLTGADPDDNEDWRLARDAVKEVAAMRTDLDLQEARNTELEADAERLDSGRIMFTTRDAYGEPAKVTFAGVDLRAAIDAARGAK